MDGGRLSLYRNAEVFSCRAEARCPYRCLSAWLVDALCLNGGMVDARRLAGTADLRWEVRLFLIVRSTRVSGRRIFRISFVRLDALMDEHSVSFMEKCAHFLTM